ncbi:unnamed protein product (mitochondrion) [Plasmodiophora brassicae]|uniref:Store-operated calcium entry-associated regulatory factor n=1 Tax=Plasmodiophora brassicae TaxID=37360 RepID=A0A3P3YF88_PLABS|nr:unnamed protein product [Plasmodiophora brassicae]
MPLGARSSSDTSAVRFISGHPRSLRGPAGGRTADSFCIRIQASPPVSARMVRLLVAVAATAMWSYAFAKNLRNVGGRFDMHTFSDVKTYHPGSVKCTHEAGQGVFHESWSCRDWWMPRHLEFERRWTRVTCDTPGFDRLVDISTCYLEYAVKEKPGVAAKSSRGRKTGGRAARVVEVERVRFEQKRVNVGAIVGGIAGFLVLVLAILLAVRQSRRRRMLSAQASTAQQTILTPVVLQPSSLVMTTMPHPSGQAPPSSAPYYQG